MAATNEAMSEPTFHRLSIEQILQGYRDGSLTPDDVATWCERAYELMEPRCHAWESFDAGKLREQAAAATARLRGGAAPRALEGIPLGVKDIFNTADLPTQMGSPLWRGFTPGNDARVLYDARRAGVVIPGKTVTAEFAVHALGKTLNPHDAEVNPGTSSSGSAVAVAAGMVPVALGTQTAGSIVRPASFCGVWGCKPSFGLIPRTGMLKTTDSLDTVGFFVAHASDLQRVLDAIRVHGRDYPISHAALSDERRQAAPEGRPWRVAVVLPPSVAPYVAGYAQDALREWTARLGADTRFSLQQPQLPEGMEQSHEVHAAIYDRSLAYYFKEEFQRAELISPMMNELIVAGQKITPAAYEEALARQVTLARRMDAFFADCDVLVTLSTAGEGPLRTEVEPPDSALMWTLAHLSVVSAPAFVSPHGRPFGLQLVARRYNDPLLFRFVEELVGKGLLPPGCNPRVEV